MSFIKTLTIVVFLSTASTSYALIDGQVFYGKRTATIKPEDTAKATVKGNVEKLAIHLSPIPLVPVSAGFSMARTQFKEDVEEFTFSTFKGSEIAFELSAWIPVDLIGFTPYAKLGYVFMGSYDYSYNSDVDTKNDYDLKPRGVTIAAGVKWSPLPMLALLLEFEQRIQQLETEKAPAAMAKVDFDYTSSDILIGLQLGI